MSSSNYTLPIEVMERMGLIKLRTASKFAPVIWIELNFVVILRHMLFKARL